MPQTMVSLRSIRSYVGTFVFIKLALAIKPVLVFLPLAVLHHSAANLVPFNDARP